QRVGAPEHRAHLLVHQRGEYDGLAVAARRLGLDACQALVRLLRAVDERQGDLAELDTLELREQAVAEHLRRDAGAVGQEKDRSLVSHVMSGCGQTIKYTVNAR